VVDEEPLPDLGAGVDLDAGEEAADVGYNTGQDGDMPPAQGVRQAVILAGMKAGISQQYLQGADRRRVIPEDGVYIHFNTFNQ
jgi:hypothetical protein